MGGACFIVRAGGAGGRDTTYKKGKGTTTYPLVTQSIEGWMYILPLNHGTLEERKITD